jgi:hypothetical protein
LLGKSGNELLVFGVIAVFGENAEISVLSVESFSNLVESLNKTYYQINLKLVNHSEIKEIN